MAHGAAAEAGPEQAVAEAYRALSARDRTEAELRALLLRRGAAEEDVEAAIAEVRSGGYLDDAAYARRFAEDRRRLDGWGAERIAQDLSRRGVAPDVVEAEVAADPDAELAAAIQVLGGRIRTPPANDRERARAWRMLAGRGYPSEVAYAAVRAFERGEGTTG